MKPYITAIPSQIPFTLVHVRPAMKSQATPVSMEA